MANKNQIILENLELVDVQYEDNNQLAILTYLDEERGEIREVKFNKQIYNDATQKYIPDAKKSAEVDEWCEEYFQTKFEELAQCIGDRKTIYCYPKFNSLWECKMITKFEEDMLGQIFEVEICHAEDDGKRISLQFEYEDGNLYETKMQYAKFFEAKREWLINPQKRESQYKKFEEKFQIPIERLGEMVGKKIMIEIKKAMGKYIYAEAKPFPKKKAAKAK